MSPTDFVLRVLHRHLFDDSLLDEGLKIILIHKHRTLGGMFVPKGGAKVEVLGPCAWLVHS